MIEVYTKSHCRSSRKALKLLEISGVCYEHKNVSSIKEKEFLKILKMTENVQDIIVIPRVKYNVDDLTLKQLYKAFEEDNFIIKTPLIIYNNKVLSIGYNLEKICRFIEKELGYVPDELKEMIKQQIENFQIGGKSQKKKGKIK